MSHLRSKKIKKGKFTFIEKQLYLPDEGKPKTSYVIYEKQPFCSAFTFPTSFPEKIGEARTLKEAEEKMRRMDVKIEKFKRTKM